MYFQETSIKPLEYMLLFLLRESLNIDDAMPAQREDTRGGQQRAAMQWCGGKSHSARCVHQREGYNKEKKRRGKKKNDGATSCHVPYGTLVISHFSSIRKPREVTLQNFSNKKILIQKRLFSSSAKAKSILVGAKTIRNAL